MNCYRRLGTSDENRAKVLAVVGEKRKHAQDEL